MYRSQVAMAIRRPKYMSNSYSTIVEPISETRRPRSLHHRRRWNWQRGWWYDALGASALAMGRQGERRIARQSQRKLHMWLACRLSGRLQRAPPSIATCGHRAPGVLAGHAEHHHLACDTCFGVVGRRPARPQHGRMRDLKCVFGLATCEWKMSQPHTQSLWGDMPTTHADVSWRFAVAHLHLFWRCPCHDNGVEPFLSGHQRPCNMWCALFGSRLRFRWARCQLSFEPGAKRFC